MSQNTDEQIGQLTQQLHDQYVELNQIVDTIDHRTLTSFDAVTDQLTLIKQTEAELQPLRTRFVDAGKRLPESLQTVTDDTVAILEGLLPKLSDLEEITIESAKRLFPKVQQGVRAVQMQNAYTPGRRD